MVKCLIEAQDFIDKMSRSIYSAWFAVSFSVCCCKETFQ